MKKTLSIVILILLLISCSKNNCISGNGVEKIKKLHLDAFENITTYNNNKITVREGNKYEVTLTGDANIIDKYFDVIIANNTCFLKFNSDCTKDYNLDIEITIPKIGEIISHGSDEIIIKDITNQSAISLYLTGSGNVNFNKTNALDNLHVKISGSSDVIFNTETSLKNSMVNITGSGNYKGYKAATENINIISSGSGDCEIFVTKKLDATIYGSGSVFYKGKPEVSLKGSGSGKIISTN